MLTLHRELQETQKLFVDTSKIRDEKREPPLMEEDWVVLCQALYKEIGMEEWRDLFGKLERGLEQHWCEES